MNSVLKFPQKINKNETLRRLGATINHLSECYNYIERYKDDLEFILIITHVKDALNRAEYEYNKLDEI